MKKRVKLLTTIASLCLAVALMAFGVYAATASSFGVTSNVTFTAEDGIFADVTVTRTVGEASETVEESTYTGDWATGYTAKETLADKSFTDAAELTSTNKTCTYTITITNYTSTNGVTATLSWAEGNPVLVNPTTNKTVLSKEGTSVSVTAAAATTAAGVTETSEGSLSVTVIVFNDTFTLATNLSVSLEIAE